MQSGEGLVVRGRALTAGGECVCFGDEGIAVFVRYAAPGDLVRVRATSRQARAVFAELVEVLEPSEDRVRPECPLFGRCGGCDWSHVRGDAQSRAKETIVADAMRRIGGFPEGSFEQRPLLPPPLPFGYRNKATWHVRGGEIGFFGAGGRELLPCRRCLLQKEPSNLLAAAFFEYLQGAAGCGAEALVTRVNRDGESLVAVVSPKGRLPAEERLVRRLTQVPGLRGIALCRPMRGENPGPTSRVLFGQERLPDRLAGLSYDVLPQTFSQVNPPQADALVRAAMELLRPQGRRVLDLYCGAGALSLAAAAAGAASVLGMEIVPEAVQDARRNARLSGIENAEFLTAPVEKALPGLLRGGRAFDAALLDPPRRGCDPAALRAVAASGIPRLLYVSCGPATLARDCRLLASAGYSPSLVQPVDMFPQTCHVECVVLMSRVEK